MNSTHISDKYSPYWVDGQLVLGKPINNLGNFIAYVGNLDKVPFIRFAEVEPQSYSRENLVRQISEVQNKALKAIDMIPCQGQSLIGVYLDQTIDSNRQTRFTNSCSDQIFKLTLEEVVITAGNMESEPNPSELTLNNWLMASNPFFQSLVIYDLETDPEEFEKFEKYYYAS